MLAYFLSGIPFLLFELLCIVHAVRNGNVFPWIYVMVFLPMVGCIAYVLIVILPEMSRSRGAAQLQANARAVIDPHRTLRQAHRAAEMVGSVDAKRALAEEYAARGAYSDAIEIYRDAAQGQFKDDPALLMGLARTQFLGNDYIGAIATLDALQAADPNFISAEGHMLYARALEALGRDADAIAEYRRLVPYFAGEEARARLAMALDRTGQRDEAQTLYAQIVKFLDGAPSHYRKAQKEWGAIAKNALR